MTATALRLVGRPPTTIVGLEKALERAHDLIGALREDLLAERLEGLTTVEECRARANRVHLATVAERPDLALFEAGAIVAIADRFVRQRSSGAL